MIISYVYSRKTHSLWRENHRVFRGVAAAFRGGSFLGIVAITLCQGYHFLGEAGGDVHSNTHSLVSNSLINSHTPMPFSESPEPYILNSLIPMRDTP